MSKRIAATFLGICASLCGIVVWILLSYAGFIAGLAGALMGIAFLFVYKRINKNDKSIYPHVVASVVIIVDIILAELITISIIAAPYGVSLSEAMQIPEISRAVMLDVIVGLLLSFVCYFSYLVSQKRKKKNEETMTEYNQSLKQMLNSQPVVNSDDYKEAASTIRKITIIREKKFAASLVKVNYFCDGAVVGTAKNGETVTFNVDGRPHSLCAKMAMSQSPMVLVEPDSENKTYKLKLKMNMSTVDLFLEKEQLNTKY